MGLATPTAPLRRLLAFIREVCPEIVHQTDVYGRTFIHRAYSIVRNREPLAALLVPFNTHLSSRRDAFGFNPLSQNKAESVFLPPRRAGGFQVSTQREELGPFRSTSRPPSSSEDDSFVAYHARLVEVIWSSYNNPRIEDSEGRNGLHCLAEAIINPQTMDRHMQRPNLKRKLSTKDITVSTSPPTTASTSSQRPPPSSSNPGPTITTPIPFTAATADEGTLSTRLRHLHSLLDPTVGVDPTHYDRFGTTPLMAFVEHIPDHHDDKAKTLQTLLETLVGRSTLGFPSPNMNNTSDTSSHPAAPGPSPILEARNRRGETALLVAARLGRKVALATLLELGANVGVRDVEGRGVLEVIDDEIGSARARADVCLYARLEACRALLTGRREWGVRYQRGRGVEGSVGLVQGGSVEGADRGAGVCEEWRVRV
ncbi:uncharacterized protein CTHT_0015640 [Thermochaetoides thermophila DSM 1495]|uniref:Uncharacterized protein n=1 Tax=Chaetomium thermophilum (strain DSM 1495 / CBS 144.50 / IMI 039719) TaxID=759272 RepID=G0S217_CHATD|nr:hypothetical protein CTHT_0015640 [Thermochaetoides thermophila DSM 1495]EGS23077.1 hypothetical protein CTHT_0015640 [Thermochaetoides thermophila DSM 1495]